MKRLDELAARYALAPEVVNALSRLLELLSADETAPTTVREPSRAVDVHVADALAALDLEPVRSARSIADLGAGAGFPGLVLAAALPEAEVFLVESVGKKCAFIERAIAAAGLANASVVCGRAEEWTATVDLVTARALAPLAVIVEYAAPLLRVGGHLVAWKGARDAQEEADAAAATEVLGLSPSGVERVEPFPGARDYRLYLYSKVTETPSRFPRRAGMASKRPLRSST